MPSVRITRFAGLLPEVAPRLLREDHAQIAHNTLLWDGYLRPLPDWQPVQTAPGTIQSIFEAPAESSGYAISTTLVDAQQAGSEPFTHYSLWGLNNGALRYYLSYANQTGNPCKLLEPPIFTQSQTITPQHLSTSPIQRTYALTYMAGNMESAPTVFNVLGVDGTLFEGDFVTLNFTFQNRDPDMQINKCRLYRTVVGFDTGENIENPRQTVFHLVAEIFMSGGINTYIYVDQLTSDMIPGDRCLTEQFGPMLVDTPTFVGQTESGWLVIAGPDDVVPSRSVVHVSDKFLWHAFALQNFNSFPDIITDAAVFYDDIFFGTKQRPYHMRIAHNEDPNSESLNIHFTPFPDKYGCVPGTMVTTNFGAMYASPDGLIALQVNEDDVATKKVANPGDILNNPTAPIDFGDTLNSAWWNGLFIGFCTGVGYIFVHENSHNNQYPLSQLVTFTPPAGIQGPSFVTGSAGGGLLAAFGNVLYRWPMPGYGYEAANKQIYRWKSKQFVMPGGTTFAAAKVVNDADGQLHFNFYGDGVLIYSISVFDSKPFRIPAQHSVITVELEVIGQATVREIHLATSMRELTETTGTDYA